MDTTTGEEYSRPSLGNIVALDTIPRRVKRVNILNAQLEVRSDDFYIELE